MTPRQPNQKPNRGNWVLRLSAVLGSAGIFTGFWQLALHNPHPAATVKSVILTPTPTDSYTVPTGSNTPLPLPAPPHGSTGVSR